MLDAQKAVYAFSAENNISYRHAYHARVSAISECALAEKLLGGCMPKNLLLAPRNESAYYLLIMHPESAFKTGIVSKQAGSSRLSFATDEALNALFHTHSGAVSPFGFLFDTEKRVSLLIDRKLLSEDKLIFHPLENTASVLLERDVFLNACLPLLDRTPTFIDMPEIRKDT